MRYRFSFDMGTNSLGWAVYELNLELKPIDLTDCGVRIFSDGRDPKSGASLAVERRGPRSQRRRRDRYLQRRTFLMDELIKAGLMPPDEIERKALEKLDPYVLRAKGLDQSLSLYEFGRILFHLNQRRGFQSNRIADAGKDDESGKIKTATKKLIDALAEQNCRTYGEFLAKRQAAPKVREREAVRIRLKGQGAKALYDFYPTRDILKDEFEKLWAAQTLHHLEKLSDTLKARLFDAMFFQRPLKPPPIGKCTFFPEEERISKAHPLSQARRIYQDLNHLRLKEGKNPERPLTLEERDKLAFVLLSGEDVTFKTGMRKILKNLAADTTVSLEEEGKRDRLIADQLAHRLSGKKGPLAQYWGNFTPEQRADIALKINTEEQEKPLIDYLKTTYDLPDEVAKATATIRLPDGYDSLGEKATTLIVEQLKKAVIPYSKAVELIDRHHSDERDGVIYDQLPFYGEILQRHTLGGSGSPTDRDDKRYGRIANPTVHVGLNQLRRVVNALVKLYGNPEQIVIELARDLKMSQKQKDELASKNKENEKLNEKRKELIENEGYEYNQGNLRLLRLWEELGDMPRRCVYTGKTISLSDVFSSEIEVEHILPYSRTLDDTMANKTLAYREANRGKRNMTPAEAFSGQHFEDIRLRAQALPKNKRWRFEANAMEKYEKEEGGFAARQLNDTRHLAKIAKKYLIGIANNPNDVWVVTGQLTAILRQRFGLNSILSDHNRKNRFDHRHHAIDAVVIGICDRRHIQAIANESKKYETSDQLNEITKNVPEPFEHFRDKVKAKIEQIIVSHKPEHGTGGALHNETSYGINQNEHDRDEGDLITRKAIESLTPNEVDKVRDLWLREQLQAIKAEVGKDIKALAKKLAEFGDSQTPPIRRVRILKKQEDFIPIKDKKTGENYRAVIAGENHHADIVEDTKGKWKGFSVSFFEANQKICSQKWKSEIPGGRLIMRLHKNDLVELIDIDGTRRIKRVVVLDLSAGRIRLAEHNESGELQKRHEDVDDHFRWDLATISKLKERECKLLKLNEIGKTT